MRSALKRMIIGLVLIAAFPTASATAAQASDDLPRGPGVVASSVQVAGSVTAIGYTGGIFSRGRETRRFAFNGSVAYAMRSDAEFITEAWGCAGSHGFDLHSSVWERREDGAVRVNVIAWTWDNCELSGHHGPWRQAFIWVPANASETIAFTIRSNSGATVVSATFTNNWSPHVDDPAFARPVHWVIEDFRDRIPYLYRFVRTSSSAEAPEDSSRVGVAIDAGTKVIEPIDLPPIDHITLPSLKIDVADLLYPTIEPQLPGRTLSVGPLLDR